MSHEHQWSLAWSGENRETYVEEDRAIFYTAIWLCPCGGWRGTKHKWENHDERLFDTPSGEDEETQSSL